MPPSKASAASPKATRTSAPTMDMFKQTFKVCDYMHYLPSRERRAVEALSCKAVFREELDRLVGVSNSPDVILRLRKRGFDIFTEIVAVVNRFNVPTHAGRYHLVAYPPFWNGGAI